MQTTAKPPFEVAPWNNPLNTDGWQLFRVGTCNGQWRSTPTAYEILSVVNDDPGNGHFAILMEYFEASCKRDKRDFIIREVWNKRLQKHLGKLGFLCYSDNDFRKTFK